MEKPVAKSPPREARSWLDPFDSLHDEMDRVFSNYFRRLPLPHLGFRGDGNGHLFANLDLKETENELKIEIDAPGVKREDIDITLSDNSLMVKGKRESKKEEKKESYHRIERDYGEFERRLALPCEVDPDRVEANLKDGVLTIILPKSAKAKEHERKIEVRVGA